MQAGYIKSLDGIRALAIVLVMTFHFEITQFGWLGVQLFFVLSGFLISGILWKEKSRVAPNSDKFKKFWVRRSLRIFPLYFAFLLVFAVTYLLLKFPAYFPVYAPFAATYTINFSRTLAEWQTNPVFTHLWSLSVEEQFYLVFPLIMFLCPPRVIRYLMVTVILLAPAVRYALALYYSSRGFGGEVVADIVYWNTLSHLDAFFIGGIIPVLSLHTRIRKPQLLFALSVAAVVVCGVVSYYYSSPLFPFFMDLGYSHGNIGNYQHVWHYTLLNVLFASLVLLLVSPFAGRYVAMFRKLMENRWLVNIGRVSYGMYIFHWVIIIYVFRPLLSDNYWMNVLVFIPYLVVVYLVAELSYRFFEVYFIRLKDKLFPNAAKAVKNPVVEQA